MLARFPGIAALLIASAALGQTLPKNLDNALAAPITIDVSQTLLSEFSDALRQMTQTNIVLNWNALAQTGLTRETPIDLHLKGVAYEQVIKTLIEILPATGSHPNYTVDVNTLMITTNADLGKGSVSRFYSVQRVVNYPLDSAPTKDQQDENGKLLQQVLLAEILRSGEPLDGKAHGILIKDGTLAATLSARGQNVLDRALAMFNAPLKIGQLAAGTQLTVAGKRTQEAFKSLGGAESGVLVLSMAREPQKYADKMNLALLPGTKEELATGEPRIGYAINEGGVLLLGPRELMRNRTVLAVYDIRDLIRRLNFKNTKKPQPTPAEYQTAIVNVVRETVHTDGGGSVGPAGGAAAQSAPATTRTAGDWGGLDDLGKVPSVLLPYNGLLVVFATPETHRTLAAALQDMNK